LPFHRQYQPVARPHNLPIEVSLGAVVALFSFLVIASAGMGFSASTADGLQAQAGRLLDVIGLFLLQDGATPTRDNTPMLAGEGYIAMPAPS
jgi:hypothetical protein